jgi:hypothetical protein
VTAVARPAQRRPLWLTVPLYAALLAVLGINAWAAEFWLRVGGQLGSLIGGGAVVVVLIVGLLLAFDARRQLFLGRD